MPDTSCDLLTEPLIGVDLREETRRYCSLPDVLSLLGSGEIQEFTGLQAHQEHAWHAFLTQLAAIALVAHGDTSSAVHAPETWKTAILRASKGVEQAWWLFSPDTNLPGFMQSPVPGGDLSGLKRETKYPDQIDILVTSKNHDVKRQRQVANTPEQWMYALINLQTMQGYSGAANYGIARMNGGLSNRAGLSFAADPSWATRFRRDTLTWIGARPELSEHHGYPLHGGHALLWLDPWDGTSAIPIHTCDPFFIEICRRVRMRRTEEGSLVALTGISKVARVQAAEGGVTGDIWTLISKKDGKALTSSRSTLSYRKLPELLFGADFAPGAALALRQEDGPQPVFVGRTYIRGQGKSEGLHYREVPIPPAARRILGRSDGRTQLGQLAKRRLECVTKVANAILKVALLALAQGGADKLRLDDRRMDSWLTAFDAEVDSCFFEHLFSGIERPAGEADNDWARHLLTLARPILSQAEKSAPIPSIRRHRAVAMAWRMFEGGARKHFPDLYTQTNEGATDDNRAANE